MSATPPPVHANQSFRDGERLFRRVLGRHMKPDGRATFLAFELPDMSVNREEHSTAEQTRKGFRPEDWGVVSIRVSDMPPRQSLPQAEHSYRFRARHVPEIGNYAHSEIRVWREGVTEVLLTQRAAGDFAAEDPDRECARAGVDMLDPDFHMRWRKRLEWRCRSELRPSDAEA